MSITMMDVSVAELTFTDDLPENEEAVDGGGKSSKIQVSGGLKKMPFYQNLRHQLSEQLKSLESRLEAQLLITSELQDYFKKKSELEAEFSKMLDKMYKGCVNFKRKDPSQWAPTMLSNLMLKMLNETKKEAKERLVLSEICGLIVNRLGLISEDLNRIFKQVHTVAVEGQEELIKVLQELYLSSKSYQAQNLEWKQAEAKLKNAENQKAKAESGLSKEKIDKSKKCKALEKEVQKRLRKATDTKFKALKAKNEYILCMDAANAAVQKYFVEDLSDLIDCMDLGYYESISTCLKLYAYSEEIKKDSLGITIEQLNKILTSLDSRVDKQKFLEAHNSAFVLPKKFEFPQFLIDVDDAEPTLETPPILHEELEQRMYLLERRLTTLKIESNELWKTLETAEGTLLNLIDENWTCAVVREWFAVGGINNALLSDGKEGNFKNRSDRVETDQFHINKYRDWMLSTSRVSRLDAKFDHIKTALGVKRSSTISDEEINSSEKMKRRKRIGQRISSSCKLFGGSLEEYLEANKCEVPLVLKSCIRVVNLFGLHHQGIFRVSGSQVEINNFRDAFERGEDPLCELTDASDINSVASLLKLYLRELREPIFPLVFFDYFMEVAQLDNDQVFIERMRTLFTKSIPRPIFIVLRYLFHFLSHLSEYNEENMMDPYNIAICFGPTLVPVPDDKDQVQFQNLVNELIKNVIVFAHEIFPNEGGGEVYRKYCDDVHSTTASSSRRMLLHNKSHDSTTTTDDESSTTTTEEHELSLNAVAQYDFKARSGRELNLKKGQKLRLVTRVSGDWWKGVIISDDHNSESTIGLIPHKYISVEGMENHHHQHHNKHGGKGAISGTTPPMHAKKLSISEPPLTPTEFNNKPLKFSKLSSSSESGSDQQFPTNKALVLPQSSSHSNNSNNHDANITQHTNNDQAKKGTPPPQSQTNNNNRNSLDHAKYTPDLVLDLPSTSSSSNSSSSSSSTSSTIETQQTVTTTTTGTKSSDGDGETIQQQDNNSSSDDDSSSSEVTVVTGAEVFAKQNQCTLKKITVTGVKPKVMVKPKLPKNVAVKEDDEENDLELDEHHHHQHQRHHHHADDDDDKD